MATSKSQPALSKVKALSDSLDSLNGSLQQLYSRSLPETLLSLDNLQQAKVQVALPYCINDLIFSEYTLTTHELCVVLTVGKSI